jgi:hypothetical protein
LGQFGKFYEIFTVITLGLSPVSLMLCLHISQYGQNSSSKVISKTVQINAGGANTCGRKLTFVLITAAGLMGGGGKHGHSQPGHGSSGGHGGGGGAAGTAINLAKSALASGAMGKKGMMASAVLGGGGGGHGGGGHGGGGSAGGLIILYNNDKYLLFHSVVDPHPDPDP